VSRRRSSGALEAEVLAALWSSDEPLTPAQVREQLPGDLAYTTVLTTLVRLHEKGVVAREPAGRAFAYRALQDEAELAADRMRSVLDATEDRHAALTRFLGTLSSSDEQLLARLLPRASR
jgi:predicted transcriptional regulator